MGGRPGICSWSMPFVLRLRAARGLHVVAGGEPWPWPLPCPECPVRKGSFEFGSVLHQTPDPGLPAFILGLAYSVCTFLQWGHPYLRWGRWSQAVWEPQSRAPKSSLWDPGGFLVEPGWVGLRLGRPRFPGKGPGWGHP